MNKPSILFLFTFICLQTTAQTLIPYLKLNGKIIFVDSSTMKPVIEKEFEEAGLFQEGLSCVRLNGKYAFIDKTGKAITEFKYETAFSFKNGMAKVIFNNRNGFIDKTGKEIISPKYEYIGDFHEGLAFAELNEKFGFIDKPGKEIIPCQYNEAGNFSNGLAWVKQGDKYGFIDKTGKLVVALKYKKAEDFNGGLAKVLDKRYGCIDKTGKEVIPTEYDFIYPSKAELIKVSKWNGKTFDWGFVDRKGKMVIPLVYSEPTEFTSGISVVIKDGKLQLLNKLNKPIAALENYNYYYFTPSEGLFFAHTNPANGGKYVLLDSTGKRIGDLVFDEVRPFTNGLARIKSNGKWGWIDKSGKQFIAAKYVDATGFTNGLGRVQSNDKWFYIDRTGREYREVLPPLAAGWLFYDDFTDNRNQWEIDSTSKEFQMVIRSSGYNIWNRTKDKGGTILRKISNFNEKNNYRIEMTIKYNSVGPDNVGNGLLIGCDEKISNFYRFLITKDGQFKVDESIVGLIVPLQDWKVSNEILKYGDNKLGFVHLNGQWIFYINEKPVYETKAKELPGQQMGILISPGFDFLCKTFKVYDWTKAASDPTAVKEPLYEVQTYDDFKTNSHDWEIINDNDVTSSFTGEAYRIKNKFTGYFMPSLRYGDADMPAHRVEVDARHIDGVDDYGFGIAFAKKDVNNSFVFYISSNGYFTVGKFENGNWNSLQDWTETDAVKKGNNAINRLRYENDQKAWKWNFYINDVLVYSHYAIKNVPGKFFGCIVENKQTVDFTMFKFARIVYP